jgi:excisionase family DNA binding protein
MSITSTRLSPAEKGGSGRPILDRKWDGRSTFTVEEMAEILGLSRCSAYAAVKNGEVPVVTVGRRKIVPRVALEQMLTSA